MLTLETDAGIELDLLQNYIVGLAKAGTSKQVQFPIPRGGIIYEINRLSKQSRPEVWVLGYSMIYQIPARKHTKQKAC